MAAAASAQDGTPWEEAAIGKSWDRVVSDYKIFHDVRARGGTVGDLPAFLRESKTGPETSQDAKPETNHRTAQQGGSVRGGMDGRGVPDQGGNAAVVHDGDDTGGGAGDASMGGVEAAGGGVSSSGRRAGTAGTKGQAFSAAASDTNQNQPSVPGLLSPQTVLGGADDNLKKLLMSWYYAGYYTGLYEGQQQAPQQQQQQQQQEDGQAQEDDDVNFDLHDE